MRRVALPKEWLTGIVVALFCLPCLLPVLIAAGVGASLLGVFGAVSAQVWLALGAALVAATGIIGAGLLIARRERASCEPKPFAGREEGAYEQ